MRKEISEFIEKASRGTLSEEADKLLNEITLVQDTMESALMDLAGATSLNGTIRLEMKVSTDTIKELATVSDWSIHEPSDFSPYCWMLLTEELEGGSASIVICLHGTLWEIAKVWEDTQVH